MKNSRDHFEAQLRLISTDQGGRTAPISTGYMPNWWLPRNGERELASAAIEVVGSDVLAPGATGTILIYPFAPELWQEVEVGTDLEMTEGPSRIMGNATVTRVVPVVVSVR